MLFCQKTIVEHTPRPDQKAKNRVYSRWVLFLELDSNEDKDLLRFMVARPEQFRKVAEQLDRAQTIAVDSGKSSVSVRLAHLHKIRHCTARSMALTTDYDIGTLMATMEDRRVAARTKHIATCPQCAHEEEQLLHKHLVQKERKRHLYPKLLDMGVSANDLEDMPKLPHASTSNLTVTSTLSPPSVAALRERERPGPCVDFVRLRGLDVQMSQVIELTTDKEVIVQLVADAPPIQLAEILAQPPQPSLTPTARFDLFHRLAVCTRSDLSRACSDNAATLAERLSPDWRSVLRRERPLHWSHCKECKTNARALTDHTRQAYMRQGALAKRLLTLDASRASEEAVCDIVAGILSFTAFDHYLAAFHQSRPTQYRREREWAYLQPDTLPPQKASLGVSLRHLDRIRQCTIASIKQTTPFDKNALLRNRETGLDGPRKEHAATCANCAREEKLVLRSCALRDVRKHRLRTKLLAAGIPPKNLE